LVIFQWVLQAKILRDFLLTIMILLNGRLSFLDMANMI